MIRHTLSVAALAALFAQSSTAATLLQENFDGVSVNSVHAFATNGGSPGSIAAAGGANGNVAQITNLNASNVNSLAWNAVNVPGGTPALRLSFAYSMTTDAQNTGCCGEAADGFGIGFFPAALYGATGASNPGAGVPALGVLGFNWENPVLAGIPFLAVGFDTFEANNISLNWNGSVLGNTNMPTQINDNLWHNAVLTIQDMGASSLMGLTIDGNVIFSNVAGAGVDLDALGSSYRLIAGGRTGGAWMQTRIDNILVESIPEPSSAVLALAAAGGLLRRRRR